jgi:NADPH2:quinone reductase
MNAILVTEFGTPEQLRVETRPIPDPTEGQVLVRVAAAGVNPVDTYIRSGAYAKLPPLPWTPGTDGAGVVEAVGPGVESCRPGDRVYTSGSLTGTYAEVALCRSDQVHTLPDCLSFEQGAAIGIPYATAWRALVDRAAAAPGDCVLVHGGTGGVGIATVQIALRLGMQVHATAGSDHGEGRLRALGIADVHRHDRPGYSDTMARQTPGGCGFDVVVEMAAHINLGRDLGLLAPGGRVAVVGSRGPVEINPRDTMLRDTSILGVLLANTPPDALMRIHAALGAGFADGSLAPVVGRRYGLAEAPEAHRAVMQPGADGKVVLLP